MKPNHNRAAQFAPFAALTGFEEAVAKRRERPEGRRTLAEEEKLRLGDVLASLTLGDCVRAVYYTTDCYLTTEGILTDLDPLALTLTVVKTVISFSDLFTLEKI